MTTITLHVIVTANDDGSQEAKVSPTWLRDSVTRANQHYQPAGIQFTFDPATDIETIHSTLLNQDVTVPSNVSLTGLPDTRPRDTSKEHPVETQHVVYRSADRHIYELFYGPGLDNWRMNDLTRMLSLRLAKSKPSGYTTDAGAMQHIVYVGSNNHIYELFYKVGFSGWRVNDLTLSAGLTVSPVGNPVGYITPGDVQHVVYRGTDSHIYELFTGPGDPKWHGNGLTQAAGAPLAAGDPTAYVTAPNTNHVVYRGADRRIYELFYGPGLPNWRMNDLTQAAGAPRAAGNPVGYTTGWDTIQHVVYRAANNHIYELFYPSSAPGWGMNGLTQAAAARQAASDPAACLTDDYDGGIPRAEIQHVVYRAANNHIYELFYPSGAPGWGVNGLTQAAGAPLAAGSPTAYNVNNRKDQHVIYTGTDGRIHELFYGPGGTNWQTNDLSLAADAPANASGSPSAFTHGAGDYYSNRAARNRIAVQHLGKLVVYINYGTWVEEDTATHQWEVKQRTGHYSNSVDNFVSMGSNTTKLHFLGHEIGHYLHLHHPFGPRPNTEAEANELIRVYVDDRHHNKSDGAQVFDADAALIGDTPPDPGPVLWEAMKGTQCSSSDTIQLTVELKSGSEPYTLQPMRQNLMSYFNKDCPQFSNLMFFTNDQIARMRSALETGNRQHLKD